MDPEIENIFSKRSAEKRARVAEASEAKRNIFSDLNTSAGIKSGFTEYNYNDIAATDGDNLGVFRLGDTQGSGRSFDAFETFKDDAFINKQDSETGRFFFQEKLARQRSALDKLRGLPEGSSTNEDVFAQGELGKQALKQALFAGQSNTSDSGPVQPKVNIRKVGDGFRGRDIVEAVNPVTGEVLSNVLNNRENNASFDSDFNQGARRSALQAQVAQEEAERIEREKTAGVTDAELDTLSGKVENHARRLLSSGQKELGKVFIGATKAVNFIDSTEITPEAEALYATIQAKEARQKELFSQIKQEKDPAKKLALRYEVEKTFLTDEEEAFKNPPKLTTQDIVRDRKVHKESAYRQIRDRNIRNEGIKVVEDTIKDWAATVNRKETQEVQAQTGKTIGEAGIQLSYGYAELNKGNYTNGIKNIVLGTGKSGSAITDIAIDYFNETVGLITDSSAEMVGLAYAAPVAIPSLFIDKLGTIDKEFKKVNGDRKATPKEKAIQVAMAGLGTWFAKGGADAVLGKSTKIGEIALKSINKFPKPVQYALNQVSKATKLPVDKAFQLAVTKPASLVAGSRLARKVTTGVITEGISEAGEDLADQFGAKQDASKLDVKKAAVAGAIGAAVGGGLSAGVSVPSTVSQGIQNTRKGAGVAAEKLKSSIDAQVDPESPKYKPKAAVDTLLSSATQKEINESDQPKVDRAENIAELEKHKENLFKQLSAKRGNKTEAQIEKLFRDYNKVNETINGLRHSTKGSAKATLDNAVKSETLSQVTTDEVIEDIVTYGSEDVNSVEPLVEKLENNSDVSTESVAVVKAAAVYARAQEKAKKSHPDPEYNGHTATGVQANGIDKHPTEFVNQINSAVRLGDTAKVTTLTSELDTKISQLESTIKAIRDGVVLTNKTSKPVDVLDPSTGEVLLTTNPSNTSSLIADINDIQVPQLSLYKAGRELAKSYGSYTGTSVAKPQAQTQTDIANTGNTNNNSNSDTIATDSPSAAPADGLSVAEQQVQARNSEIQAITGNLTPQIRAGLKPAVKNAIKKIESGNDTYTIEQLQRIKTAVDATKERVGALDTTNTSASNSNSNSDTQSKNTNESNQNETEVSSESSSNNDFNDDTQRNDVDIPTDSIPNQDADIDADNESQYFGNVQLTAEQAQEVSNIVDEDLDTTSGDVIEGTKKTSDEAFAETTLASNTVNISKLTPTRKDSRAAQRLESADKTFVPYNGQGAGAKSALGYIHNLMSKFAQSGKEGQSFRLGLVNKFRLTKNEKSAFNNFAKFNTAFAENYENIVTPLSQFKENFVETPVDLLRNQDTGATPENIVTASAIVIREWLATRSSETSFNTSEDILSLLGQSQLSNEALNLHPSIALDLQGVGKSVPELASILGRQILQQANIGTANHVDGALESKLENSVGMRALLAANKMGYLEFHSRTFGELQDHAAKLGIEKDTSQNGNLPILYVRVRDGDFDENLGSFKQLPALIALKKAFRRGEKDVYKKMFATQKSDVNEGISDSPITEVEKTIRGTVMHISPQQEKALEYAQQVEWTARDEMFDLVDGFSQENLGRMIGVVPEENIESLHITNQVSATGRNRAKLREMEDAREFIQDRESGKPFFLKYRAWKNLRIGDSSTTLSPQRSKLHRHLFGIKTGSSTIELDNSEHMNVFAFALDEAGLGANALTDTKFDAAIAILNKGAPYSFADQKVIADVVVEGKKELHTLDGLQALAAYRKAKNSGNKTFVTRMPNEVDGTTNGITNAVIQMATGKDESIAEFARRGGYMLESDPDNYTDIKDQDSDFNDNYQNLTIEAYKNLDKIRKDPKHQQAWKKRKQTVLDNMFGDLVIQQDLSTGEISVSSEGRTFSKDPLLTKGYGASNNTILKSTTQNFIQQKIYDKIEEYTKTENQPAMDALVTQLEVLINKRPGTLKLDVTNKNNYELLLSDTEYQAIADSIKYYHGKAIADALGTLTGPMSSTRDAINEAITTMNKWFVDDWNAAVEEHPKTKQGLTLSKKDFKKLEIKFRDTGLMPAVHHIHSTNEADKMITVQKDFAIQDPAKVGQSRVNLPKTDPLHVDIGNGNTKKQHAFNLQVRTSEYGYDLGMRPFLNLNIAQDANTQIPLLGKHDILNLFDAQHGKITDSTDVNLEANKIVFDNHVNYNMVEEVYKAYKLRLEHVIASDRYNYEEQLQSLRILAKTVTAKKKAFTDKIINEGGKVDHFAMPSSRATYVPGANQTQSQNKTEVNPENAFNSDVSGLGVEASEIEMAIPTQVTSETVTQVFEDLESTGNTIDSVTHKNHLRSLVDSLIKPMINLTGEFNLRKLTPKNSERSRGEIRGHDVVLVSANASVNKVNNSQLSNQEVFTHELIHPVWEHGLKTVPNARLQVQKLFKLAKAKIKPEDLLPEILIGTREQELKAATARYNYIFKNGTTGLMEFATFGITNEKFIELLGTVDTNKPDTTNIYDSSSIVQTLMNIFSKIGNTISDQFFGISRQGATADVALANIAQSITKAQEKSRIVAARNTYQKQVSKVDKGIINKLSDYVVEPYNKWADRRILNRDKQSKLGKATTTIGASVRYVTSGDTKAVLDDVAYKAKLTQDNLLHQLMVEIRGANVKTRIWHKLLAMSKHTVDAQTEHLYKGILRDTTNAFAEDLTDDQWKALNNGILKTDIVTLVDSSNFTIEEVVRMMEDRGALMQSIESHEAKLKALNSDTSTFYNSQSDSLGHYMAQGTVGLDYALLNAYNIANFQGVLPPNKPSYTQSQADAAEILIDELTSLRAIQYTSNTVRHATAQIWRSESAVDPVNNGISNIINTHRRFKAESLKKQFNGSKISTLKGYTHEFYDENVDVKVGTLDDVKLYKQQGFELVNDTPLKNSALDVDAGDAYLFRTNSNTLARYVSGVSNIHNTKAKGTPVGATVDTNNQYGFHEITRQRDVIRDKSKVVLGKIIDGTLTTDFRPNKSYLVPVQSHFIDATDFRYMMSEQNKVDLLNKEDLANRVIARMSASVTTKVESRNFNRAVVEQAKIDFDNDYAADPRKFTHISKYSSDPRVMEIYKLMPDSMKGDMYEVFYGIDGMYIQTELLNMVFGFRKISLANGLDNALRNLKFNDGRNEEDKFSLASFPVGDLKKFIHMSESIWEALVGRAKSNIVIKTPAVLKNNVISNMILSWNVGIPITYMLKNQAEGLKFINIYMDELGQHDSMKRELTNNPNLSSSKKSSLQRKIDRLDDSLKNNPVQELISKGVFQSIVEDIENTESTLSKAIRNALPESTVSKYDSITDKAPKFVKETVDIAYLSDSTKVGKTLIKATQYSDFVARYAMYKYRTQEQGIEPAEALEEVVDTFINYDENTSPLIQWTNDVGLLMYTKFMFRIQRVLLRTFKEHPINSMTLALLQKMTTDLPDIADANLLSQIGLHRTTSPNDILDDATDMNILHYFDWLFK